ncbi:PREDICTED: feruloyl CoA ortho-hydroxylase 2-like [Camelina sativa]|uniref:Feruloyl CoA ortho-hydroxylase 2-like n=1 Tax=Camelina sativa TaxID=90675 RepID=A0ABM1QZZ7_CAMSA|nr:PREDICTED: feruloyl CoA ortho-hydroxylase 2-like [Camelina sativa]
MHQPFIWRGDKSIQFSSRSVETIAIINFEDQTTLFNFVVKQGNGVKGMIDSGLSSVPQPFVQPQAERIPTQNALTCEASQPIDLSHLDGPHHKEVAKQIVEAAETLGFFQVVNHGVSVELLELLKTSAHEFFAKAPEEKAIYLKEVNPSKLVKYGTSFVPDKEKAIEWKDYVSMIVYTNDHEALQQWPEPCREVALKFLKSSMEMVKNIVNILMENVGVRLEEERMNGLMGTKMVNMNYYPTCPSPELTIGVGRHSDMGMLTVLLQDGIGGLYVKLDNGEWAEIPPVHGALVINIGDTFQILSYGKYKSAEHRVRTTNMGSRVSVPIFTAPNPSEKIGPLPEVVKRDGVARYKELLFKDYMSNFFGQPHDGKKSLDFARAE